ncbi:hypothetical protein SCALM49S_05622 [Streptomyces californicus]
MAGVAGDDGRRGDPGVGGQAGLDLPSSMRKPRIFNLVVAAPEELQRVVRTAAHQVAGAVHPPPGVPVPRAEGVRDEPLRRQVGAAQVAEGRQAPATYSSPVAPAGTGRREESRT